MKDDGEERMRTQSVTHVTLLALLLPWMFALTACGLGKPVASIGSPAHGSQLPIGQEVLVQVNATDAAGIAQIELWLDGVLQSMAQSPSPQTTHSAVLRWTPTIAGSHMLVA